MLKKPSLTIHATTFDIASYSEHHDAAMPCYTGVSSIFALFALLS